MKQKRPRKRFANVLVATDFSRGSESAVRRAVGIPLVPHATVHLLHVLPEGMPPKIRARAERKAWDQIKQAASMASAAAEAAGNVGLVIIPEVVTGQTYVEIIQRARSSAVELVVIGRHRRRAIHDLFFGSTAIRVIRNGDLPVLVVNSKPTRSYRRPLIAVDLEDASCAVLDLGLRVLESEVTTIAVVHAYNVPFEGFVLPAFSVQELDGYRREFQKKAETGLAKLLLSFADRGVRWKAAVRHDDPRRAVLREASRRRTDLIAVGTHARSGLSHVLLGSVAEWVIRAARCDVLVARPARFSFELP